MAAGRPIVSIDFPQVQQYSRFIEVASGAEEFAQALTKCIEQPEQTRIERQNKVADESWQAVATRINHLIQAV